MRADFRGQITFSEHYIPGRSDIGYKPYLSDVDSDHPVRRN